MQCWAKQVTCPTTRRMARQSNRGSERGKACRQLVGLAATTALSGSHGTGWSTGRCAARPYGALGRWSGSGSSMPRAAYISITSRSISVHSDSVKPTVSSCTSE